MIFITSLLFIVIIIYLIVRKTENEHYKVSYNAPHLLEVEKANISEELAKDNLELLGELKYPDDPKSYIGKRFVVLINGRIEQRGRITGLIEEAIYQYSQEYTHISYSSIDDNGEESSVLIELYGESPYYEIAEKTK